LAAAVVVVLVLVVPVDVDEPSVDDVLVPDVVPLSPSHAANAVPAPAPRQTTSELTPTASFRGRWLCTC
jgi:hypothetical protein